jgi:ATP-dependent 26S proteasome regulatory subunit
LRYFGRAIPVLRLTKADLADDFWVVPPRALVLLGPPGTGKPAFAGAAEGGV